MISGNSKPAKQVCPPTCRNHTANPRVSAENKCLVWGHAQRRAFTEVKRALRVSPILSLFDPKLVTTVSADPSSFGLGNVLMQKQVT